MNIKKVKNLFLIALALGPLYVIEQWFFGFEQAFADVKAMFSNLRGLFDNPDKAILFVITIFVMLWLTTIYLLLSGGRRQYAVTIIFGFIFISEIHHMARALSVMTYYPGMITGFLLFLLGAVFLKESLREFFRREQKK